MFLDDFPPPAAAPEAPQPSGPAPWRGRDVLFGIAMLAGGYVLLVIAFSAISAGLDLEILDGQFTYSTAAMLIVTEAWIGALVLILARRRGISLRELGFRWPRRGWVLPAAVFGSYGALAVYAILVTLIEETTGRDFSQLVEGNPLPTGEYTTLMWVMLGLGVVVIAPIAEELFFRGLLYQAFARMWPVALAMLLSGIGFALLHLNVSVVIPFTAIGIIFAWSFRHADSIWTPIGAHAIVNGVSFILTVSGVEA